MFSARLGRRAAGVSLVGLFGAGAAYIFIPDKSRSAPTVDNPSLSPSHFTRATLTSSEPSGPNTKLLVLTVHGLSAQTKAPLAPIWSVFIKDDDIQVERPYTPLEGIDEHGRMLFWIKKYPKGEVGRWLHSKKVGDTIEFRGPLSTWAWKEDEWDEVVMISGGTGITPFYQLLHSSIAKGQSKTRFTLLHSSPTPSELPPPEMLGPLREYAAANPQKFGLHLFVDRPEGGVPADVRLGRISKPEIQRCLGLNTPWWRSMFAPSSEPPARKIMFLICGPEPMINAIAGPYGRNFSQGEVGGALGELGYTSRDVRKL
ncbi:ferredoxin reductase-like protein [Mycena rosella]|uniref:Ferredoxin reductase-like protein n=1 Tax=Mycena rosella TaxID=1033263 RepID=A0AAD7DCT1_MYCRO|nr:ferredoxin reductase-like protein [Mycena rosella]